MIPAYQNDLQMFPIFRMQFALLDDLCIPAIISCEKLDLRVNISGCASYGAFSRNWITINILTVLLFLFETYVLKFYVCFLTGKFSAGFGLQLHEDIFEIGFSRGFMGMMLP